MKVFAFPTHGQIDRVSGVDFARVIQPMEHLGKLKGFNVTVYDPRNKKETNWVDVAKDNDLIYLNYTLDDWGFAAMGCMARKYNKKMIIDVDDSLWDILPDNPVYNIYHENDGEKLKNFNSILLEVDAITTTSQYLKNVIHKNSGAPLNKIYVFPNRIDLNLYNHISPTKEDNKFTILHFGSTTHFISLSNKEFLQGLYKIMDEFPNVVFKTVGSFMPEIRARWGERYINAFGDRDIYQWIKGPFRDCLDEADVVVAPLENNLYNRCKSNIKYLETSSTKTPFIGQAIRQYQDCITNGKNGYTAMWGDNWYNHLKELITNPGKKKEIGESAYQNIVDNHQMKNYTREYGDLFKYIIS